MPGVDPATPDVGDIRDGAVQGACLAVSSRSNTCPELEGAVTNTRREVWSLGTPWNDTLLWYAKAVGVMKNRPLAQRPAWRYLAAMHGIQPNIWANSVISTTMTSFRRRTSRTSIGSNASISPGISGLASLLSVVVRGGGARRGGVAGRRRTGPCPTGITAARPNPNAPTCRPLSRSNICPAAPTTIRCSSRRASARLRRRRRRRPDASAR